MASSLVAHIIYQQTKMKLLAILQTKMELLATLQAQVKHGYYKFTTTKIRETKIQLSCALRGGAISLIGWERASRGDCYSPNFIITLAMESLAHLFQSGPIKALQFYLKLSHGSHYNFIFREFSAPLPLFLCSVRETFRWSHKVVSLPSPFCMRFTKLMINAPVAIRQVVR